MVFLICDLHSCLFVRIDKWNFFRREEYRVKLKKIYNNHHKLTRVDKINI